MNILIAVIVLVLALPVLLIISVAAGPASLVILFVLLCGVPVALVALRR